jgi:hypothetical protein
MHQATDHTRFDNVVGNIGHALKGAAPGRSLTLEASPGHPRRNISQRVDDVNQERARLGGGGELVSRGVDTLDDRIVVLLRLVAVRNVEDDSPGSSENICQKLWVESGFAKRAYLRVASATSSGRSRTRRRNRRLSSSI